MKSKNTRRKLRKKRSSSLIKGTSQKPRVVIYKSNRYLLVQAINDSEGHTLVYSSTADFLRSDDFFRKNENWAQKLGELFADKLKRKGIKEIVFDRNGYLYHGKIKALDQIIHQSLNQKKEGKSI